MPANQIFILREGEDGATSTIPIDLKALLINGNQELNVPIMPNDVISVPVDREIKVFVMGRVTKPGAVTAKLSEGVTLFQAIAEAGGFAEGAKESGVTVTRKGKSGSGAEVQGQRQGYHQGQEKGLPSAGRRRRARAGVVLVERGEMKNGNEIQLADYEVAEAQEINLRDYWDRIWRRRTTVLVVALAVFVLGTFWTFVQKPVYTAKSQLLIEKEPNILSFDQVLQIEAMRDDFYQTQYKLLSGRGLADTVIERLKLYENPEFIGKPKAGKKPNDPTDHVFREGLIDGFLARLSVRPVRLTRLVDVSFDARDPKLAADCVNDLAAAFIDLNINMKYAATEQATTFLSEQIKDLQSRDPAEGEPAPGFRGRGEHRRPERHRDDGHRPAGPAQQGLDRGPDRPAAERGELERVEERQPRLRARGHQQSSHPEAEGRIRPAQARVPDARGALSARLPRAPADQGRAGVGPQVPRRRDPEPGQGGLLGVPDGPQQGAVARSRVQPAEGRSLQDELVAPSSTTGSRSRSRTRRRCSIRC